MVSKLKIAICVEDFNPSGGVHFIVRYAEGLSASANNEITLIARSVNTESKLHALVDPRIRIIPLTEFRNEPESFDLVIATWWGTYDFAFEIEAFRYAWFIQSLESRFYDSNPTLAIRANKVQLVDIPAITVAPWIKEYLEFPQRKSKIYTTTNGVNKKMFYPAALSLKAESNAPLRVVVEGSAVWFKGIAATIQGISQVSFPIFLEWFSITGEFPDPLVKLIRENRMIEMDLISGASQEKFSQHLRMSDVLVKSSKVEGMPGPYIEAFHCGITGIYSNVTGIETFARHTINCLVSNFDDPSSITKWLAILNDDREFLADLKASAVETANAWPSDSDSMTEFINAINDILENEPVFPWKSKTERFKWIKEISHLAENMSQDYLLRKVPLKLEISPTAKRYLTTNSNGETFAKNN